MRIRSVALPAILAVLAGLAWAEQRPSTDALADRVQPDYPEAARLRPANGTALIQALISRDGRVADACILMMQPEGLGFETAGLDATRAQSYRPMIRDGEPVAAVVDVWIDWSLGL